MLQGTPPLSDPELARAVEAVLATGEGLAEAGVLAVLRLPRRGDPGRHAWCDRCGDALTVGDHGPCRAARALEPPRYCTDCRRRMKVQVLPGGWRATCVEHGHLAG